MSRIAPRTVYGLDGIGVRRRFPVGSVIPDGIQLEEPIPHTRREPDEAKRLRATKADRRGIVGKPKGRTRKQR